MKSASLSASMIGKTFERLSVISRADDYIEPATSAKRHQWNCECVCGSTVVVLGKYLRDGRIRSCGCLRRENSTVHGQIDSGAYTSWKAMKRRCSDEEDPAWRHYGGRGISVDPRWDNFDAFYADMGERPEGMSIDRIDNNAGYGPGNCRWATRTEQNGNRRDNVFFTADGKTQTISAWSRATGIKWSTIKYRINQGLPPGEVLKSKG